MGKNSKEEDDISFQDLKSFGTQNFIWKSTHLPYSKNKKNKKNMRKLQLVTYHMQNSLSLYLINPLRLSTTYLIEQEEIIN